MRLSITLDSAVQSCGMPQDVATAIQMALEKEFGDGVQAAIAMAMHLYMGENVHDEESYILTIQNNTSEWSSKSAMMRQLPDKAR